MDLKRLSGLAGQMQHSTLALLLWDEAVDAVMVEHSILGPSISVMERFPKTEEVFETIAARIAGTGRVPSRVAVCLPRSETAMRTLRYPAIVQNDLEQMVPFEATRHLAFPENERCLGYTFALTEDAAHLDVHLLAARSTNVNQVLESVQAAGIPVDVALAFSSLAAEDFGAVPSVLVVSDSKYIEVALVCNGVVCDSMCVPRNGGPPTVALVQRMMASNHDRIGPGGIARLVIAGPEPFDADQAEELSITLGVDAKTLNTPDMLSAVLDEFEGDVLPEGLLAASCMPQPSLNLTLFAGRRVPMSRRTKWMLGLAALLVAEVAAGWVLWTNAPARALKNLENEMSAVRYSASPTQKMKDQNRSMRRDLMQLQEMVNNRASIMEMLKILSDTIPEDTYLTQMEYERGGQIQIDGRSKAPDGLPALLLLDVPFVSSIEASDIAEKRGEYYNYSLAFSLKGIDDE